MIRVNSAITIEEKELRFAFKRSSGPGGQNVNKVSSAVQLRFDAARSPSLPDRVRERLVALAGSRVTKDGVVIIDASRHRTQERNREDAVARLIALIRAAARRPKRRRATKPTRASREQRLVEKQHRSKTKRARGPVRDTGE